MTDTTDRTTTPVPLQRPNGVRPAPTPEPAVDVLAALETLLTPTSTDAAKADVLKQVREARERARRDRPQPA